MQRARWWFGLGLWLVACTRQDPSPPEKNEPAPVVGSYEGGVVTEAELTAEVARLPPALREQFETPTGRAEFLRSMIDKRLLVREARRRGFHEQPDIQRQVRELEERLTIQALMAEEEKAAAPLSEEQLRAYYDAHSKELTEPERVRVIRVLAQIPAGATAEQRTRARQKAEQFAQRLRRGEPAASVAAAGDGPERVQGGDVGLFALGERREPAMERAAFALKTPGEVSPVVEESGGYSVLQFVERRAAHVPSFEEVSDSLRGRLQPQRKRQVFEDVLARLRKSGGGQP